MKKASKKIPDDPHKDYLKNNKYRCPSCGAIHWWPAKKCFNPKCKHDKPLPLK